MADPSPPVIPLPSPCCYQHLPPPSEESPPPPVPDPANCTVLGTAGKCDESESLSLSDRGPGVNVPSSSHTSASSNPTTQVPTSSNPWLSPTVASNRSSEGFAGCSDSDDSDDCDDGLSALNFPPTEGQVELLARADAAAALMEKRFEIRNIATAAVRKQSSDQVKECVQNTSASSGRTFVFVCACNLTRSRSGWDSSLKKTTWRRVACGHCPSQRPQPG